MTRHNRLIRCIIAICLLGWSVMTVQGHGFKVLVFTKTSGAVHASTPAGITAINQLSLVHDFEVTQTDNAATFISVLPTHQVVVFLNTSGDVLDGSQQAAFETWYQNGGGFVGIHSAVDTEPAWSWYHELVGATGASETSQQTGTVKFLDQVHPITNSGSPRVVEWAVSDQWYNFTASPRGTVHVLAVLDELVTTSSNFSEPADTGITGGTHGNDHPIIWCQEFDGGRSAYLGPGHSSATFSDSTFQDILVNSIEWAAGETGGDSGATINANFEKVVLDGNLASPMSIDIAPDGKVYIIERGGAVKVHDETTGVTTLIGTLNEYSGGEYGGLGIALAPDFSTSKNLYILWSPSAGTQTRLSRFTLDSGGNIDFASEVVILQYTTNRPPTTGLSGHHQAGCVRFDNAGNLLFSAGDDTQASGYSPRSSTSIGGDARKAASNTNDLRGKILRITPNVGGGPAAHPNYTIPAGNLFAPGTPLTREEIYVMGCRNPFRFCVDPVTGWLYYGDVGPDATNSGTGAYEGVGGHDEFNQVKTAGWFGWPYYLGDNKPYFDGNSTAWTQSTLQADLASYFSTSPFSTSGLSAGDPSLLVNPQPAWIWYPDGQTSPRFTEIGTSSSRCAMAGAVYQSAPGKNLPAYYDRSVFIMEWSRNLILDVKTRTDGSILEITRFAPNLSFSRPHEMRIGPNGKMYVIEWGSSFGSGTSSDTALVKVQYTKAAATPVAIAAADVTSGGSPLTVQFSSAGSYDPDSNSITYEWDFDGDQITDSTEANPLHVFSTPGTYAVQLTVTDGDLLFSRASVTISVGNHAPLVAFTEPVNFSFFDWGDTVNFAFTVTDSEDGTSASGAITAADAIVFEASLGHDDHQHNEVLIEALEGNLLIPRDSSHPFDLTLSYVLDAYYTDSGAPGVDPIQGTAKAVLKPKVTMAQAYDGQSGVTTAPTSDAVGGDLDVTSIDHGDQIWFGGYDLYQISAIRLRASAAGSGGSVEIRQDSATGNLIGTVSVTSTGSSSAYQDFTTTLSGVLPGTHPLYLVFTSAPGATNLMHLNWINFRGQGSTWQPGRPVVSGTSTVADQTVRLTFDQEMDRATLANPASYSIDNGATISSVTPAADQKSVDLLLDGSVNSYYTVSMSGLEDLAGDTMATGSKVTFLLQPPSVFTFYQGLNAAGPDFTDSAGNLYIADTTPTPPTVGPGTLLVDMMKITNPAEPLVPSNPSDFLVGDANIDPGATINTTQVNNSATAIPLTGTNISGATLTNVGATGSYTTNKGTFDDVPIFDGYIYHNSTAVATSTLAGLGDIMAGSAITLTLWGIGDAVDSDTVFTVKYNGSTVGTQTTDYDTATLADTSPARVQFTFNKVQGADSITIEWGKPSSGGGSAGFNGLSLTTPQAAAGGGGASYFSAGTTAKTYTAGIANTLDDILYQSERYATADFSYAIPLPTGTYNVLLRFAENYWTAANKRSFNVHVEGGASLFTPGLDLFAASGGKDVAYDHLVTGIQVSDGALDIDFVKGSLDNPKISAIGVFQQTTGGNALPDPSFARFLEDHPDSLLNPAADVDSDSLTTLMEYALGGSDSADDTARLPALLSTGGGEYSLNFNRPEGLPDVDYEIVASNDLSTWLPVLPVKVTTPLGGGIEQVQMTGLISAASIAGLNTAGPLFFKLQVSLTGLQP